MAITRTDLALESMENLKNEKNFSSLHGVTVKESRRQGFPVTAIHITDPHSGKAIGKPVGHYATIDLRPYFRAPASALPTRSPHFCLQTCAAAYWWRGWAIAP